MQINSFNSKIFIDTLTKQPLNIILEELKPANIVILVDENTREYCLPQLYKLISKEKVYVNSIKQGEENKDINTVIDIWNFLQEHQCDRNTLMINLGGGLLLDIGGFAASTYKRGMPFVNIPTTLLSMVDASVGGKVGFNFNSYKNHIGLFQQPSWVLIIPEFLKTLDKRHIYSGWAEMIKHGLIHSEQHIDNLVYYNPLEVTDHKMKELIHASVQIKNFFVEKDPYESNIRKVLNFGHTIGHALESYSFNHSPLLHGEAVAMGMVCELYLSVKINHFPESRLTELSDFIHRYYPKVQIDSKDFPLLIDYMKHDKKNRGQQVNFTLLEDAGKPVVDQFVYQSIIEESIGFLNSLFN